MIDPGGRGLLLYQEDLGSLASDFIGAVPGHSLVGAALTQAVEAVNRGDGGVLWLSTGPALMTRLLAATIAGKIGEYSPGRKPRWRSIAPRPFNRSAIGARWRTSRRAERPGA